MREKTFTNFILGWHFTKYFKTPTPLNLTLEISVIMMYLYTITTKKMLFPVTSKHNMKEYLHMLELHVLKMGFFICCLVISEHLRRA